MGILVVGLCLFGVGEGTLVAAGLGNTPWTVLAQGIAGRTPLDIGAATIAVSIVVLLGWIPLRQTPGLGTIANVVLIGLALDVAARVLPEPRASRGSSSRSSSGSPRSAWEARCTSPRISGRALATAG